LLETDAPDMPISGRQGQSNSPLYLPEILACLATLRGESERYVEQATDQDFNELFLGDS